MSDNKNQKDENIKNKVSQVDESSEIGDDFFQAVAVETSAGHVLGAAVVAALDQEHLQSGSRQDNGGGASGKAAAYDYGVQFFLAHGYPPSLLIDAVSGYTKNLLMLKVFSCPKPGSRRRASGSGTPRRAARSA